MISKIRPKLNAFTENLVRPYAHTLNPNHFSYLLLASSAITYYLFSNGYFLWGTVSLLFSFLDLLDGAIARAGNKESAFGGVLDAVIDRIQEIAIYLGLGASGMCNWHLVAIALSGSIMVSYTKSKAESAIGITKVGTNELSIGIAERPERIAIIGGFTFLYSFSTLRMQNLNFIEIGLCIISVATIATIIMRMSKAYSILKQ